MIFDYETLKVIWWCFVGAIIIVFALTDGWDLGIGILSPLLGHTNDERRVILRSIEPNWEGNQTWLIIAGGVVFAAWPLVYAAAFSGMYVAMLLVLFALFFRPVGFKYRNKVDDPGWRRAWDWGLFIGGFVPTLVFGVAFGNLLQGVPFHFDNDLRAFYSGTFWQLLNPFALVAGVLSIALIVMHGACYLRMRVEGELRARAARAARLAALAVIALFAIAGVWVATGIDGYRITSIPDVNGVTPVLGKKVEKVAGAWLDNYTRFRFAIVVPLLAFGGALIVVLTASSRRTVLPLLGSACAVVGVILTAGLSMFPFIMPSSTNPGSSLTAWDAVSSKLTLQIMFWVVVVFLPIVTLYTTWVYAKLRGTISIDTIRNEY
ncbi:MAG: cytochrome d ubiquinol oxidase subunit II [Burkholderiales bacterium]